MNVDEDTRRAAPPGPIAIDLPGGTAILIEAMDESGPAPIRRDVRPEDCDHRDAYYSSDLALHCPACGVPMFLPARFLAHRSAGTILTMREMWKDAGHPSFTCGTWAMAATWLREQHPLFEEVGGLPVAPDRATVWRAKWGAAED